MRRISMDLSIVYASVSKAFFTVFEPLYDSTPFLNKICSCFVSGLACSISGLAIEPRTA